MSNNKINEITRHEREVGAEFSDRQDFVRNFMKPEDLANVHKNMNKLAFTMTQIPKVGLNPRTQYDTPAGVYAYILDVTYFYKLLNNDLPFASDSPYCSVLELNRNEKWLFVSNDKTKNLATDEEVQNVIDRVGQSIYERAQNEGRHWNGNNDSKIFDLTYFASKKAARPTFGWTAILRSLGYVGIYDPGHGIIHPSEPEQIVFLSPKGYTLKKTYETASLRKEIVNKETKTKKQQQMLAQATFKYRVPDAQKQFKSEDDVISFLRSLTKINLDLSSKPDNLMSGDEEHEVFKNRDLFYQIISGIRLKPELMSANTLREMFITIERLFQQIFQGNPTSWPYPDVKKQLYITIAKNPLLTEEMTNLLIDLIINESKKHDGPFYKEIDGPGFLSVLGTICQYGKISSESLNKIRDCFSDTNKTDMLLNSFLLSNPNTPPDIVEQEKNKALNGSILPGQSFSKELMISRHRNTPEKILREIYKKYGSGAGDTDDENVKIDLALLENSNLPKDLADKIKNQFITLFSRDYRIIRAMLDPFLLKNILRILTPTLSQFENLKLIQKLSKEEIIYEYEVQDKIRHIFQYANLSPELIHFFVKKTLNEYTTENDSFNKLMSLINNKNCSLKTLNYIIKYFNKSSTKSIVNEASSEIKNRIEKKFGRKNAAELFSNIKHVYGH